MMKNRLRPGLLVLVLVCGLFTATGAALAAEPLNLLLIGVDGYSDDGRGRSDAMLLARIDPSGGDIRLVSFLRDLYVSIPDVGKTRLNAAYFYGGEDLLARTLENAFGVRVDHTVTVNFSMLAELIDELGGVEVNVNERELKQLNDILADYNQKLGLGATHQLVKAAGLQTLNGKQALSYSRIRKIDSDFQRTGRQQAVLNAILERVRSLDFFSLTRLISANLDKVRTDLGLQEIGALLPLALKSGNLGVRMARVPFDGAFSEETVDGMQVLTPNLQRNRQKLRLFLEGE